ncbi:unnamed protein product [Phaeothamnion confervicola]
MMTRLLLIGTMCIGASVQAQPTQTQGLLPTHIARPLLEQDPGVVAARAGLQVARQEAGLVESSPYEWTTKLSGQRRTLKDGPDYQEWSAGIERPLRLPGKATADRSIGKAAVDGGQARYGEALHEAATELLSLWLDWLGAERGRELAGANRQSAQENLAAVEKRSRAGDASKLDVSLAQADLAEQSRAENDAATLAIASWGRLNARFPGLGRQFAAFPEPSPIQEDAAFWISRILAESDGLKVAQAQLQNAQAQAARSRAEKMPDPTLGIYTASEAGGRERILGISISIPLPGGQRNWRADKAVYSVEVMRGEVERKKRQLEADIAGAVATAKGAHRSLQIAETGASAMQNNAKLMQRAYSLGEADLQALLLVRQQATSAAQNALAARVTALKSYFLLLVDAHLVWDLDQN